MWYATSPLLIVTDTYQAASDGSELTGFIAPSIWSHTRSPSSSLLCLRWPMVVAHVLLQWIANCNRILMFVIRTVGYETVTSSGSESFAQVPRWPSFFEQFSPVCGAYPVAWHIPDGHWWLQIFYELQGIFYPFECTRVCSWTSCSWV